ncbi:MAG: aldo/keto reductase [Candidatus Hydrogenedentes bacterium]|nr:aldo/keto reductase [Candidatus Hydrogenedentota bacterium]
MPNQMTPLYQGCAVGATWQNETVPRLILGTAQLGMDYGIANTSGRPDVRRAVEIIELAWSNGVRYFDTAQSYGESEGLLGRVLREFGVVGESLITSKLAARLDPEDTAALEESIERTFGLLGVERLWCMLLHNPEWLDVWDRGLGGVLLRYREAGRIRHLGVSLRSPKDILRYTSHPVMEVYQVACSAWDRRMINLGFLKEARNSGKLCCVRSIYHQGLMTMSADAVAQRLPIALEASKLWHALAQRRGLRVQELAVRFALTLDAPLVVGAETPEQLEDTLQSLQAERLHSEIIEEMAESLDPILNEVILEPSRWSEFGNP